MRSRPSAATASSVRDGPAGYRPGLHADPPRLWDWAALGTRHRFDQRPGSLSAKFDRSVATFVAGADGRSLICSPRIRDVRNCSRAPTAGGVREVGSADGRDARRNRCARTSTRRCSSAHGRAPSTRPKSSGSIQRPAPERGSTSFNTERAAQIDWQPLRDFWFTSARGARIHSFIALPPGFDPSRRIPAVRADARRSARDVHRSVRGPLELPSARAARLRRLDDELHGLDRLMARNSRRPSRAIRSKDRRSKSIRRPTRPSNASRSSTAHDRRRVAPVTAVISRTGSRSRQRATRRWSATPGCSIRRSSGGRATRSSAASATPADRHGKAPRSGRNRTRCPAPAASRRPCSSRSANATIACR